MLFRNLSISTLVCLNCGDSILPNEIVMEKVGDLKVPAKIKSAGTMFRMLACPNCKSPHLGFIPAKTDVTYPDFPIARNVDSSDLFTGDSVEDNEPCVPSQDFNGKLEGNSVGFGDVNESIFEDIVDEITAEKDVWEFPVRDNVDKDVIAKSKVNKSVHPKKANKINNAINEDDFSNLRKPKERRNSPVIEKIKCTSCGKMTVVNSGFGGDFGTKCEKCLKDALQSRKR